MHDISIKISIAITVPKHRFPYSAKLHTGYLADFTTINGVPVCEMPLPASLTSCTPSVSGSAVEWLFPASDTLQGGSGGVVSYEVVID